MKKNSLVDLSGEDFVKKLKPDDIMGVPEFFSALHDERMTTDASVSFPDAEIQAGRQSEGSGKVRRLKQAYYDAVRAFFVAHPKSTDGHGSGAGGSESGPQVGYLPVQGSGRSRAATSELAQGSYLVARATPDLEGTGTFADFTGNLLI